MSNVLIVDDSAFSVEFQKALLESIGVEMTVDSASTLAEAKRLLQNSRYDLCVLDISLPDGKSTELIPLLRESNPECKVAALTIYTSRFVDDKEHFDLFLTKPIDKDRYLQEIGQLLRTV